MNYFPVSVVPTFLTSVLFFLLIGLTLWGQPKASLVIGPYEGQVFATATSNDGTAIVASYGLTDFLSCSVDGGKTWQEGRIPIAPYNELVLALSFGPDGRLWGYTNKKRLFLSHDTGLTWTLHASTIGDNRTYNQPMKLHVGRNHIYIAYDEANTGYTTLLVGDGDGNGWRTSKLPTNGTTYLVNESLLQG